MRRFVKNNKGMTLIELLIAVTILGLVAAPLLHGFLTSAQTEVKARKMGEVTSVAQNVMEVVEGNTFEDVVTDESTIFGVTSDVILTGENYQIKLPSVAAYPGGRTYSATVDIKPLPEINNKELSEYTAMDVVFQVGKSKVESDRTIELTAKKDPADSNKIIFELSFDVPVAGDAVGDQNTTPETGGSTETPAPVPTPAKAYSYTKSGANDVPSVYLFYYPSYKTDGGEPVIFEDTIEIVNRENIEFDLFLVKQRDAGMAMANLDACELGSKCHVIQRLSGNGTYTSGVGANIYTNIRECLCYTQGSATCSKNNITDKGMLGEEHLKYDIYWGAQQRENVSLKGSTSNILLREDSHMRAYEYTVNVYLEEGTILGTMKGTILK